MSPRVIDAPRDAIASAVLDDARAGLEDALALLSRLVETSSHADDEEGVRACLTLLAEPLSSLGFDAQLVPGTRGGAPWRRHLVASRRARCADAPTLLVLGHADTVFPRDHAFRALSVEDDRWIGPGVSDMKGGLVTALLFLRVAAARGVLDRARVRVVVVGDEEQGSPSGTELLRRMGVGVDAALSFEAARPCGGLVSARKGLGVARVRAEGRTGHAGIAHGSSPNALSALARFVVEAEALEARFEGLTVSPGGAVECSPTSVNLIPDHAACDLEWRFELERERLAIAEAMLGIARDVEAATGARVHVELREDTPPMRAGDALVRTYLDAAARLGLSIDAVGTAGVGDINLVASAGAACIDGVGPEGGGFHTAREHLRPSSIAVRAAMSVLAIDAWLDRNAP